MTTQRALLAEQVRRLIEATVRTTAGEDELARAAERVSSVADSLDGCGGKSEHAAGLRVPDARSLTFDNPVEGVGNPLAPPLTGFSGGEGVVTARVRFGIAHQGAPGRVHGGWLAAVLDHAVGRAVAGAGWPAMTVSLAVEYHRGTPFDTDLDVEAAYAGKDGRKVYATAKIRAAGVVTVTASAVMVAVEGLLGGGGG